MAVIQKIRNKYGKLAGAIIALALVGFILMDAASGRFGDLFGRNTSVAKVNGDKIDVREYSQRIKEIETIYPLYSRGRNMDDAMRAQMSEETLKQMIIEKIAAGQCEKLGISTTKEEEKDMIYGANADPMIQQFQVNGTNIFMNQETNQFDPSIIKEFEKQIKKIDPSGKVQEQWEFVKSYAIRNRATNKFNELFSKASYTPKFVLQDLVGSQNTFASVSFVKIPSSTVSYAEVKVTDEDIKAYMQKHAEMFSEDNDTRTIDYVAFDVKPSKDDTARALNALTQIKGDFATAKDNENFVNSKSEDKFDKTWNNKRTFASKVKDSILNLPLNTVYGPYYENNFYKLAKIVDKKEMPDSVKARHILIRTKAQGKEVVADSVAKQRIDSIATAIKNGADFKMLAAKYSDDNGSAKTGGEYTFSVPQRANLSKEFGDVIFDGKTGDKKTVHVENDNYSGYHYIEVMEQKNMQPAYQVAIISKSLYADQNTVNAAFAKASEFAGKNATAQAFDDASKKDGMAKKVGDKVKINDFTVQGIGPAREVVRWMYEAKAGDVSPVFTFENKFLVAKLASIQGKGITPITASNRMQLEAMTKAEKKGEILLAKYKNVTSLESAAQTSNQQIQHADTLSEGTSFSQSLGYVPRVIGYVFNPALPLNKVSPAIKEQEGIFIISVSNRWTKTLDPQSAEQAMGQQKMMMEMQNRGGAQGIQDAMLKSATIKYTGSNL